MGGDGAKQPASRTAPFESSPSVAHASARGGLPRCGGTAEAPTTSRCWADALPVNTGDLQGRVRRATRSRCAFEATKNIRIQLQKNHYGPYIAAATGATRMRIRLDPDPHPALSRTRERVLVSLDAGDD